MRELATVLHHPEYYERATVVAMFHHPEYYEKLAAMLY
jgi:hypothetical protein